MKRIASVLLLLLLVVTVYAGWSTGMFAPPRNVAEAAATINKINGITIGTGAGNIASIDGKIPGAGTTGWLNAVNGVAMTTVFPTAVASTATLEFNTVTNPSTSSLTVTYRFYNATTNPTLTVSGGSTAYFSYTISAAQTNGTMTATVTFSPPTTTGAYTTNLNAAY